ncbi:MAG: TerL [Flavobacteriales bacterium]|nr:TerL [Flavobacteriales bacterium]
MTAAHIRYRPPGPQSRAFMLSEAFFRGIRGPFGSGKSTACCFEIMRRAHAQPPGFDGIRRSRWAIIRNTYPELRTTTIKTWHQWFPETMGEWKAEGPPTHRIQHDDIDLEVIFLALDRPQDISKLLSMELTGAWLNEAREFPKAVIDGVTGRVGRFPSAMMGGRGWSGIIADTNPPDTDHWWYRLAEEAVPEGWAFFAQGDGLGPDAENRENLPDGYYERMVAGKDADWINVYVRGNYGFVRDGKPVWPDYRDSMHCREFDLVPGLPIFVGMDFGLTPAAVLLQRTIRGQVRAFDELVATDMGVKSFSALLKAKLDGEWSRFPIGAMRGDPAGDSRAQSDESTCFQMLSAAGLQVLPASTNDPAIRLESVGGALRRLVDGEPGFLVHPRCTVLRKALGGAYCYARVQVSGEERYKDVPSKNSFSHVADGLQYGMDALGESRLMVRRPDAMRGRGQQASSYVEYDFG